MPPGSQPVQYSWAVVLVFPQVPIKIGLLTEASLAQVTLVRLLLVVDVPHVSLKVGGDGETALTELALVWLLACVRPQVSGQVGRAGEGLATVLAAVALLGRLAQGGGGGKHRLEGLARRTRLSGGGKRRGEVWGEGGIGGEGGGEGQPWSQGFLEALIDRSMARGERWPRVFVGEGRQTRECADVVDIITDQGVVEGKEARSLC